MVRPRHTLQRQYVLRSVKGSQRCLTTEEVFRLVRKRTRSVGRATVYRNLNVLVNRGEIFSFEGTDGIRRYAGHVFYEAIFTCQRCKKVRQLPSRALRTYVNQKMWGQQAVFFSRLTAQGLCGSCLRVLHRPRVRS